MTSKYWQCGRFEIDLQKTAVMGVVNITPDSFSDGGQHAAADQAIAHARKLVEDGVDILDLGGESTRPGAATVETRQELARVFPVLEAMRDTGVAISVDTCKPDVMAAVLDAGADIINDITGLRDPRAREVVARHGTCGVCVMHMQGEPRTMQLNPHYDDVVREVVTELGRTAQVLEDSGISASRIALDPGFGFGKTLAHNLELANHLSSLIDCGYPVVAGVSRKSMIGALTGRTVDARLAGSLAAMLALVQRGAQVVRVHDVAETVDALRVWHAIQNAQGEADK